MYQIILGIDEDEAHAKLCAEEVVGMPGDGSEKHVTLIHSFTDNPSGASATQLAPVREASDGRNHPEEEQSHPRQDARQRLSRWRVGPVVLCTRRQPTSAGTVPANRTVFHARDT